jgi:hypothetical protein
VAKARAATSGTGATHVGGTEDRWTGRTAEDDAQPARAGASFGL